MSDDQSAEQNNPFLGDVRRIAPPTTLVVFGATGDLCARKLLPAVYNLAAAGLLPERFRLIGAAIDHDTETFRKHVESSIKEHSRTGFDKDVWAGLRGKIFFQAGDFGDPELYGRIADEIAAGEKALGGPTRHVFYLATAPRFFGTIGNALGTAGLNKGDFHKTVLFVEKPFGHDLKSAVELNRTLAASFGEDQIMRIDHYLGKETVQNMIYFRFTNGIYEPVWNRRYIDHIEITAAEDMGIGHRAGYYDKAGAMRDIVQNHMMQLLALVAMEPPASFDADLIHDEKVKVLRAVKRPGPQECVAGWVQGQYGPGWISGEKVDGYLDEEGIPKDSHTDTFVAGRLEIDNWRWAGVPFYVRAGKRLSATITEIDVVFRPVPHLPIAQSGAKGVVPNELTFQVQPTEGVSLRLVAKVPGFTNTVRPVMMNFAYGATFMRESPEAYEHLVLDALLGDKTLFTTRNEVEQMWQIVDPVLGAWEKSGAAPSSYEAGTAGPAAADDLLARDGRTWRKL